MAEMNDVVRMLRLTLKNTYKKCNRNYLFSNFCCFVPMASFFEKVRERNYFRLFAKM